MDIGDLDIKLRRKQHIERQAGKRPRLPGNLRQLGARGPVVKGGGGAPVFVKVNVTGAGATRQHLSYLQWRKGEEKTQALLYGPGAGDPKAYAQRVKEDAHQFRLIISTKEDQIGSQRTQFIGHLMAQMESDLGRKLDWVAANHYDTQHPHTHIVVRGVAQGEALYMTKHYVERGIRERASQLLTYMLGQGQQQRQESLRQSLTQEMSMSNGIIRDGQDADVYRLRREQMQQTQQMAGQLGSYRQESSVDSLRADLRRMQQIQQQRRGY